MEISGRPIRPGNSNGPEQHLLEAPQDKKPAHMRKAQRPSVTKSEELKAP
jgi:hypothetical protein